MAKFRKGQRVIIKHQRELGVMIVEKGNDKLKEPLYIMSQDRTIRGYVRIGNGELTNLGYHEQSLEKAPK